MSTHLHALEWHVFFCQVIVVLLEPLCSGHTWEEAARRGAVVGIVEEPSLAPYKQTTWNSVANGQHKPCSLVNT